MIAVWPNQQALNLGNFLTFRQEIELLACFKKVNRASLYFANIAQAPTQKLPYFQQILSSSTIYIEPIFAPPPPQKIDWPPNDPRMEKWSYGSFNRVAWLWGKTGIIPELSWSSPVLKGAESIYNRYNQKVIAVHLKRQQGGPEESNATLSEWESLFREHSQILFLLLGDDLVSFDLPNVMHAKTLGMPLAIQFAFCAVCDGFMGMASGICTAAILSHTPYVILKHPQHHVKEMQEELGDQDHFSFARPRQKLFRITDTIETLRISIQIFL